MEYISAGGNRHPAVADWHGDLLAYGTDRNIALWNPERADGVALLLVGHTDTVNAVKVFSTSSGLYLLSGSVDKTVRIWKEDISPSEKGSRRFECVQVLEDHQSSVNCIAVGGGADFFATGAADATVKVWKHGDSGTKLLQSIDLKPRFFPLSIALSPLVGVVSSFVLAVAGTSPSVQLYVSDYDQKTIDFKLQATLAGHEGWIRSLEFTHESNSPTSDLLLASASQDKYIRLWRVHQGKELPAAAAARNDPAMSAFMPGKSLSNKAHRFVASQQHYSATFEALLLGHEDWIYSTKWHTQGDKLKLLSASADNSLAIWESDTSSGIWVTVARLGEISAQKGATTATGSTGGFWTGLWSPKGEKVVCLGRTGSWRQWNYDLQQDRWIPEVGIGGHTQAVTGIAWSQEGDYLLSTSSDQTTRLHAQWLHDGTKTWHEMARPQIHGYDLNCIDTLGNSSFVSGADEKLLRVFSEPKAVADLLQTLCGITSSNIDTMPDAANMPVLGLSNKAIEAIGDDVELEEPNHQDREAFDPASVVHKSTLALFHPPLEDHLSRHTLWPEIEKLYGHGYEISTLATSHDGLLIATACKASSIDHAVIRIFETKEWREIKPPLAAHSLTVTSLEFSSDDKLLLSVGRDRQWAVFERQGEGPKEITYRLKEANLKGHARMILDAAWFPGRGPGFATAGRDKQVKIWGADNSADAPEAFVCKNVIVGDSPVTAIAIAGETIGEGVVYLAAGTEGGSITIYEVVKRVPTKKHTLGLSSCPTKAITEMSWRPKRQNDEELIHELAVASEDSSLRIYSLESILVASSTEHADL